ncbi:oxygenase MpaB family protein [Streptomonospora alba]|uniref:oxygenase MpaB family protein n=1 Tax=Streptomonospora alba TaxID=183763 RepID=UPI000699482E|nr:oxygenase MpaB family protein [Streptomonospora alba]
MGGQQTRGSDPAAEVYREAAALGAAAYAILLQIAHPRVGRGVRDHSDFAQRPVDRLRGTLVFVYGLVFGTREEAERVAGVVRKAHTHVAGPGYSAQDPDLQVWVAATLYACNMHVHELVFGPMAPEDKDAVYETASVFATSLGCPRERWPATRAEFERYWAGMVASIEVDDTARAITADLFHPANPVVRALVRVQRFLASGLLPAHVRDGFGLQWGPVQQRRFDRLVAVVRAVYPRLPLAVRTLPRDFYLRDMRRRFARTDAGDSRTGRRARFRMTARRR